MAKLAAGIIGTGEVAETHARVLAAEGRAHLAYVYNRSVERGRRFATRFGAELVESPEVLLRSADLVLVCAPQHSHTGYATAALEAGVPVLCEKPGAISVAQAKRVEEAAQRTGTLYQVGFNRRFAPAYREMYRRLAGGELEPTSFQVKINRGELSRPGWVTDREVSGGFFFETTIHLLDMVRHLLGEVRSLTARVTTRVYEQPDNVSALLDLASGVHGTLTSCGHASWAQPFERVEIYGRHRTMATEELGELSLTEGLEQATQVQRFSTLPYEERWGFKAQLECFLDRVLGQTPTFDACAGAADVVAAATLAEALYRQAEGPQDA